MFFVCSYHSFPFVVPFFFLTNRHHGRNGKRGWRGGADGRTHQIVSEVLQKRKVDTGADHAKLQLARLERVMHCAGEALARGDMGVGGLYLRRCPKTIASFRETSARCCSSILDGMSLGSC